MNIIIFINLYKEQLRRDETNSKIYIPRYKMIYLFIVILLPQQQQKIKLKKKN